MTNTPYTWMFCSDVIMMIKCETILLISTDIGNTQLFQEAKMRPTFYEILDCCNTWSDTKNWRCRQRSSKVLWHSCSSFSYYVPWPHLRKKLSLENYSCNMATVCLDIFWLNNQSIFHVKFQVMCPWEFFSSTISHHIQIYSCSGFF